MSYRPHICHCIEELFQTVNSRTLSFQASHPTLLSLAKEHMLSTCKEHSFGVRSILLDFSVLKINSQILCDN